MRFRFGRGRRPDPRREGTVYRARPGFRLRGDSTADAAERPSARPPVPAVSPVPSSSGGRPPSASAAPPPHPAPPGTADPQAPFGPPGHPGRPGARFGLPDKGRRRRRHPVRWIVLLLLIYPILLGTLAWTAITKVAAMPFSERPADTPGTTYLVIGNDSREDLSREERAQLGTGQATGQRTDTMMLLHITPTGTSVLVSIPRDSYVTLPGRGKNKINAAYAFGGPRLAIATVESSTGLRVDGLVMTGLGSFASMVDAVGGVELCPKRAIQDAKAHIDVPKGCQTMDGPTALGYARARYSDPRGDLGRVERQREVLAAIAGKTLSPSVLLLPWRAIPASVAGGKALTVDDDATPWSVAKFVLAMRRVSADSGVRMTVPVSNTGLSTPAGSAVQWDDAEATKLFRAIAVNDLDVVRAIAAAQEK